MLKNLGLILLSLVVGLALCEGLLRLLGRDLVPEPDLYTLDPDVGKRMRPHWRGEEFGVVVATNAQGLRNPAISLQPPPDSFRVLALGDSWTFGYRLPEEQSYPRQLERLLRDGADAFGGRRAEVINAGVVGYSTQQEAAWLRVDGRRLQPDFVVLAYYPVNDTHAKMEGYERYLKLREIHPWLLAVHTFPRKLVLREFWRGTRKNIKRRLADARVALAESLGYTDQAAQAVVEDDWTVAYRPDHPDWQRTAAALHEIGALTREMGVPALVVLLPDVLDLARYHDDYHGRVAPLVEQAVAKAGMDFLDLEPVFAPYRDRDDQIRFPGERHPNAAGYGLIAEAVAQRLRASRAAAQREAPAKTGT